MQALLGAPRAAGAALARASSALWPGRSGAYLCVSAAAAYLCVAHAFATRGQFYPAVVYLVTSKLSVLCLGNLAVALVVALAKALKLLFLGDLRPNEVERVNEQLRYTIPEVIIALTIFREEFNARVVSLFAMLLFSKFFHIVVDERMTWVDSPGGAAAASRLQHVRLVALMLALLLMNAQCLAVFGHILREQGHSVLILFAFEYCIMELEVVKVMFRYGIHAAGRRLARLNERADAEWPNRTLYLMYGKLAVDTVKLGVYVLYFLLLLHFYTMPLPMVRDFVRAFMDVWRELQNVVESRRLRLQINRMLRPPTDAELARFDPTCAVCQEDVTAATRGRGPTAPRIARPHKHGAEKRRRGAPRMRPMRPAPRVRGGHRAVMLFAFQGEGGNQYVPTGGAGRPGRPWRGSRAVCGALPARGECIARYRIAGRARSEPVGPGASSSWA